MKATHIFSGFVLAGCALAGAMPAGATGISGDYIVGQWGSPVFSGCNVDGVNRSKFTCQDDSSTAIYSITNASTTSGPLAASTVSEGANPGESVVTFTGGTIPATHGSVPFAIGGISYSNGTSTLGTGIFGATLDLYASNGFTVFFIGSETIQFNTTVNDGTAAQNADYLTFTGLAGQSFEVYEGATATGALNGLVIGDPHVQLTSFSLDPGQDANGFIGSDPPLPRAVPEPGTLALLGLGFAGFALKRRREAN